MGDNPKYTLQMNDVKLSISLRGFIHSFIHSFISSQPVSNEDVRAFGSVVETSPSLDMGAI